MTWQYSAIKITEEPFYYGWTLMLMFSWARRSYFSGMECMAFSGVIFGPLQGYLGGTLVAGNFLVAEYFRRVFSLVGANRRSASEEEESSPWDEEED